MNRREFLALTAATAVVAACDSCVMAMDGSSQIDGLARTVDAGPVSNFAADGVYGNFCDQGFFVIRKEGKLSALSSICTHRKVRLKAQPDCSFYCKRHGSIFDSNGHVTHGPAKHDLPVLVTSVNEAGHLLIQIPVA